MATRHELALVILWLWCLFRDVGAPAVKKRECFETEDLTPDGWLWTSRLHCTTYTVLYTYSNEERADPAKRKKS